MITEEEGPCDLIIDQESGTKCGCSGSAKTFFKEFNEVYEARLKKADEAAGDNVQYKLKTLQDWVHDLTEQNSVLVDTVEALEKEALYQLELGCKAQKYSEELKVKRKENSALCWRIGRLRNDVSNLLELIRRMRTDGYWYLDYLQFYEVSYVDIFGQPPPTSCSQEYIDCRFHNPKEDKDTFNKICEDKEKSSSLEDKDKLNNSDQGKLDKSCEDSNFAKLWKSFKNFKCCDDFQSSKKICGTDDKTVNSNEVTENGGLKENKSFFYSTQNFCAGMEKVCNNISRNCSCGCSDELLNILNDNDDKLKCLCSCEDKVISSCDCGVKLMNLANDCESKKKCNCCCNNKIKCEDKIKATCCC